MQQWCVHFTTNNKQNVSYLLVQTILLSVYVVYTITRKWDIEFENDMSSLDY